MLPGTRKKKSFWTLMMSGARKKKRTKGKGKRKKERK